MFQIPAIFLKIPKNVISVLNLTSVALAGWMALRVATLATESLVDRCLSVEL